MPNRVIQPVMDKTTTVVSYATSGTVGLGGVLSSEWVMVLAAIFFGAFTALINWFYQHKRDLRDAEFHADRKESLKRRATDSLE